MKCQELASWNGIELLEAFDHFQTGRSQDVGHVVPERNIHTAQQRFAALRKVLLSQPMFLLDDKNNKVYIQICINIKYFYTHRD